MARHHIWKRVQFSPQDVYTLASDIEDYPNFIKYINAIRIHDDRQEGAFRTLLAEVRVRYKFVRERFSTYVILNPVERTVTTKLARGPFRKLNNHWFIHALDDGSSLIQFKVEYEFNAPFLEQLLAMRESKAANFIMGTFEKRAAERFENCGGDAAAMAEQIASIKGLN